MGVYNIGIQLLDADGNRNTFGIKVPDAGKTLAAMEGYAASIAKKVDDMCDSQVSGISISWSVDVPVTVKAVPAPSSNNQKGALFQFGLAGTDYIEGIRIPGFAEGLFTGKAVKMGDAPVLAFTGAMVAGETHDLMTVAPSNKFELDIDSVIAGAKTFRRK